MKLVYRLRSELKLNYSLAYNIKIFAAIGRILTYTILIRKVGGGHASS